MADKFEDIISNIVNTSKTIFNDKLKAVYLFGSYARNDFDNDSDIDFAIISDINNEEVNKYTDVFIDSLYKISLKNDVVISPCIIPLSVFEKYKSVLPFYQNIINEGILIYSSKNK